MRAAGTTIGNENRHWLVNALGFELEMELAPLMVFFRYDDVPGVIGRVGTLFGEAGVNIANMAVSRTRRGGKALMALSLDGEPPPELVEAVREQGFDDAHVIRLGAVRGLSAAHDPRGDAFDLLDDRVAPPPAHDFLDLGLDVPVADEEPASGARARASYSSSGTSIRCVQFGSPHSHEELRLVRLEALGRLRDAFVDGTEERLVARVVRPGGHRS